MFAIAAAFSWHCRLISDDPADAGPLSDLLLPLLHELSKGNDPELLMCRWRIPALPATVPAAATGPAGNSVQHQGQGQSAAAAAEQGEEELQLWQLYVPPPPENFLEEIENELSEEVPGGQQGPQEPHNDDAISNVEELADEDEEGLEEIPDDEEEWVEASDSKEDEEAQQQQQGSAVAAAAPAAGGGDQQQRSESMALGSRQPGLCSQTGSVDMELGFEEPWLHYQQQASATAAAALTGVSTEAGSKAPVAAAASRPIGGLPAPLTQLPVQAQQQRRPPPPPQRQGLPAWQQASCPVLALTADLRADTKHGGKKRDIRSRVYAAVMAAVLASVPAATAVVAVAATGSSKATGATSGGASAGTVAGTGSAAAAAGGVGARGAAGKAEAAGSEDAAAAAPGQQGAAAAGAAGSGSAPGILTPAAVRDAAEACFKRLIGNQSAEASVGKTPEPMTWDVHLLGAAGGTLAAVAAKAGREHGAREHVAFATKLLEGVKGGILGVVSWHL